MTTPAQLADASVTPRRPQLRAAATAFAWVAALALAAASCGPPAPPEPTSCAADVHEPNDTSKTPTKLPGLADHPDALATVELTAHATNDEDWFAIPIEDTGLGGDPVVTVSIASRDFSVTAWFECRDGQSGTLTCDVGEERGESLDDERPFVKGCDARAIGSEVDDEGRDVIGTTVQAVRVSMDCNGTPTDDGTLYVRVRSAGVGAGSSAAKLDCSAALTVEVR